MIVDFTLALSVGLGVLGANLAGGAIISALQYMQMTRIRAKAMAEVRRRSTGGAVTA